MPKKKFTPEQLADAKKWWATLQTAIDEAGCELDISAPQDANRINIVTYVKHGPDNYDFTAFFAFDPDEKAIDFKTLTKENIISSQQTDNVTDDMIYTMYEAAKEGCLMVQTSLTAKVPMKQRQILVDKDGLAYVGHDIDHMTPEEGLAIKLFDEPKLPKLTGNAENDEKATEKYNSLKSHWDEAMNMKEQNPEFYKINYNLGVFMNQYYGAFWEDDITYRIELMKMQEAMHKEYIYSKMTPKERETHIYAEKLSVRINGYRVVYGNVAEKNFIKTDYINDKCKDLVADLITDCNELARVQKAIDDKKTEDFNILTDETLKNKAQELKTNDEFDIGTAFFTYQDIDEIQIKENVKELSKFAGKLSGKIHEYSELAANGDIVRPILDKEKYAELSPDEALWKNLEKTINNAGFEMDFSSPEDLARLVITDITDGPNGRKDVSVHYATDPEKRPIDEKNITADEILARQKVGVPDAETLKRIKEAAKEGRLFVEPHHTMKTQSRVRQVLLEPNGETKIGPDVDQLQGNDLKASRMTEPPVKPKSPSFGTKFLAFFGNKKAQAQIDVYDGKMARFNEKMNQWNEIKALPSSVVQRTHNLIHATQGHFYSAGNDGEARFTYGTKLTDLHIAGEIKKMKFMDAKAMEEAQKHLDNVKQFGRNFIDQYNERILTPGEKINDINAYNLAGMIVSRKKMVEAGNRVVNKDGPIMNDEELTEEILGEIEDYYKSDEFKAVRENMTNTRMARIIERIELSPYSEIGILDILSNGFVPPNAEAVAAADAKKAKIDPVIERAIKDNLTNCRQKIAKELMTLDSGFDKNNVNPATPIGKDEKAFLSKIIAIKAEIGKNEKYLIEGVTEMPKFKTNAEIEDEAAKILTSDEFNNVISNITNKDIKTILNANANGMGNVMLAMNKVYASAVTKTQNSVQKIEHETEQVQPEGDLHVDI